MRLYRVDGKGKFTEYEEQAFKSKQQEETLEDWLNSNSDSIIVTHIDPDTMVYLPQFS